MTERITPREYHAGEFDDPIGGVYVDDNRADDASPSGERQFTEVACQVCGHLTRRLDEFCDACSDRLWREEKDAWGMG